ncbi:MAG: ATP-binding cassette domain-containing protein [Candidatus Acetothermia bacterium]|jgi:ABC-type ATPase involved in cell division|nr:ATP-binding cassette domain-containing protein [Candidatus Acetothermia bacterium]
MRIAIQVSELRFATEDGVLVLDNLSFGVPRDGFVFVVGPPSSGKTLLLKLILREAEPNGGQILLLGRNMARLSPRKARDLRRRVGYVPEAPAILGGRTVAGNLLFKLRALGYGGEELQEHAERALELARLQGREDVLAADLDEIERRQLALALGLCPDPIVLLCDDPFRDLPALLQDQLMDVLGGIHHAGVAILATTREAGLPRRHGFLPKGQADSPCYLVALRPGVTT